MTDAPHPLSPDNAKTPHLLSSANDIVERLMAINHADACDAADEIEELRQAILDACRILGMRVNDDIMPLAHTDFAALIVKEAVRSTSQNQDEIERLQDSEDHAAAKIEALREQVEWSSTRASEWKLETYQLKAEIELLDAVVQALVARPFRGSSLERRDRMYGSDWEAVHDALDALEARRG